MAGKSTNKRPRDNSDELTEQNPSNKRTRDDELTELKTKIKNQLRTGPGAYLTRSRCAANPVSEITQVITEAEHQHNIEVITSITNCGYFMHIVVLTYSWILWKEQNPNTSSHVTALNNIRIIDPTTFFKLDTINLIKPTPLINSLYKTELRCYAITKPNSDNTTMVAIAHYFAVLTNGVTGVLYNAYGSELTINPGYSMTIELNNFSTFIEICNNPDPSHEKEKEDGYNKYFLQNAINYWDEEDQVLIKAGVRDEYRNFVVGEPNLRIYEIEGYQRKVQEALEASINAPEQSGGGKPKRKSKRKSKRKRCTRRTRRTRRRKRSKTRRRRKK